MPTATRTDGKARVRRSRSWPVVEKSQDAEDVERRGSAAIEHDNQIVRAGWKALFSFTTKKHISTLLIAILLAIASGIVIPVLAQLLGKFFDLYSKYGAGTLSKSEFLEKSRLYAVGLVGLGAGSFLMNGGLYMSWITFGELQAKSARERLFRGLLDRDLEWYDMRRHGIGALIPRIQTQIRELQISVSQPLGSLIEHVVTACASLGLAFYNSWKLTLVTLSTVPVAAIFLAYYSAKTQTQIGAQIENLTEAAKVATTSFTAIETVKCFNGEDSEVFKYATKIQKAAKCYLLQAHFNAVQMGFLRIFTLGLFVQGFWYGTTLLDHGTSAGKIMTTFMAVLSATEAIQGILPQLLVLEKGRTAGATLRILTADVERARNNTRPVPTRNLGTCRGEIVAKDVSFAYPTRPSHLALDKASFVFPAGKTTFIIGRSGSGKSTVGQLLMRFYDASCGAITLDGVTLQSLDTKWLRSNITLVEQQSTLFQSTMFSNIALGSINQEQVLEEEVRQAAEFALLQQTINELPEGLHTLVGAKGNSMSGGQRQRMAIARARLRDTPILILDESTSALDYITRTLVMDAIRIWRRGKTTIMITHDISQIRPDDYSYVMDRGRVVQQGYRKDMEALPNSSFSTFAPARAEITEADTEKQPAADTRFRRSLSVDSFGVMRSEPTSSRASLESLAIRINFQPVRGMSYLSPALMNRFSTRPMSIGPLSPTSVPFWRTMASPVDSATSSKSSRLSALHSSASVAPSPPPKDNPGQSARDSAHLLEITGLAAMENRLSSVRSRRSSRRSKSASLLLPPKRKEPPPEKPRSRGSDTAEQLDDEQRPETLAQILKTVWPRLEWGGRLCFVFAFFAATIVAVSTPLFSYVFAQLLATFYIAEGRSQKARKWSLIVLGIACADAIATYLMGMLFQYCGQVWVDRTRLLAMRRIFEQPREFFDKEANAVSRLADNLDRNAEEMRGIVARFIGFIFVAIVMMLLALSWSLVICWKLTLVALSAGPFMYGVSVGFEKVSAILEGRSNDAAEATGTIFTETFMNIRTVRGLTLERNFEEKHTKATDYALKVGLKRALYAGFFFGLTETGVILINALVFYYGSILVSSGEVTVTKILQVFSMLLFSITTVNGIIGYIPQMSSSRDTASRLLRLSRLPQDSYESYGSARVPSTGTITFTDVSFAYPSRPHHKIMQNLNLTIPSGSATAIVGSSGSGKSTIAALLLNLYTTGSIELSVHPPITLAGRDIRHLHTPTLRSLISIVAQTATLFPATIAENITYGLREASPYRNTASIRAAAAAAGIDDFIMSLPLGYSSPIAEGGMGLSGGQAQRIAIARALVRQPRVLILDEATSALDVESAGIIRDSVQRLIENGRKSRDPMTVIIITHSKEMMKIAEKIIMLDHGRVVEEGRFEELIESKGEFARLLRGGDLDDAVENI